MRRNKMAAVGSDYIDNNIDSRTGRNWKNLSELWQNLLRLARSGGSEWEHNGSIVVLCWRFDTWSLLEHQQMLAKICELWYNSVTVRTCLSDCGLSSTFWAEAASCAAYCHGGYGVIPTFPCNFDFPCKFDFPRNFDFPHPKQHVTFISVIYCLVLSLSVLSQFELEVEPSHRNWYWKYITK